uniref:type IV secretory system conjugative DNA transfer family protein n=1 Tax=Amycolatopsis sp. CA-151526 TaxID=3239921 RepID=UPI003F491B3F
MSDNAKLTPGFWESWGLASACGAVICAVLTIWGAGTAGDALNGTPTVGNPFTYLIELIFGKRAWPGLTATLILITVAVAVAAVVVVLVRKGHRRATRNASHLGRIDAAARKLGTPRDLEPLSPPAVAEAAKRLRPSSAIDPADGDQHGRLIGLTVVGNMPVRASWEDLGVHVWGPRAGKTTALTVPNCVSAPGPVVATSNKRDLVDATRGSRAQVGNVWIFDPQQVATEPPRFWYNPLSRITDISSAAIVAAAFVHGTREPDARTDAYFDGSAEDLLAAYLLAAALGDGTLVDVYEWLTDSLQKKPQRLLEQHDERLVARDVGSILSAPEKQRAGVFDTAKKLLACLRNKQILEWVTPPQDGRPQFNPAAFVRSTDALYLLSMEQKGSAGPLVTCLTEHVCNEAVALASKSPGGRLDPPMYVPLDEAANVCRWRDLPSLYSHYGSRGVVIDTILQSWAQAEEVWGEGGARKLWGAANVRTYGGGGADATFLRTMSEFAGKNDEAKPGKSLDSNGRRTYSFNAHDVEKLPIELLASLRRGRAVVHASGVPFFIVAPQPWMTGPHAGEIQRSLALYDPGALAR